MLSTTIKQFTAITRQECAEHNNSAHNEDVIPYSEWLSENSKYYASKYGIAIESVTGDLIYLDTNKNYKGDVKCACCDDYFEDNGETGDLCPECYESE